MNNSATLYLTPEEINLVVENLRTKGGDHIARGRSGEGFGYKDGVFYEIYVEDSDQQNHPIPDEATFRKRLETLELSNPSNRYWRSVLEGLGAYPYFSVENDAAIEAVLTRQLRAGLFQIERWCGVATTLERTPKVAYLRLSQRENPTIYAEIPEGAEAELLKEGIPIESLLGKKLFISALLKKDAPRSGCISLCVSGQHSLR